MAKPSFKALLLNAVRSPEKAMTPAYEKLLRKHASAMPNWTPEHVNSLNIKYIDNAHTITYSNDDVLRVENGTPDVPFSPAIRSFMIKRSGR